MSSEVVSDICLVPKTEQSDRTAAANPLIHKYMTRVLGDFREAEILEESNRRAAGKAAQLVRELRAINVDDHRIAIVAAIAQIDFEDNVAWLNSLGAPDA